MLNDGVIMSSPSRKGNMVFKEMDKQYNLSDKQKEYITQFIFKRQEELYKKASIYQEIRKSERGISARQIYYENKVLAELSLIHTILHQLCADEEL